MGSQGVRHISVTKHAMSASSGINHFLFLSPFLNKNIKHPYQTKVPLTLHQGTLGVSILPVDLKINKTSETAGDPKELSNLPSSCSPAAGKKKNVADKGTMTSGFLSRIYTDHRREECPIQSDEN